MALDADRWKLVDALLQSALERAPERREEFLQRACGADEALAAEVRSLLTCHRQSTGFLQVPAIQVAAQDMTIAERGESPEARTGDVIPHYRILEPIGSGGMGSVWLAERSDGRFERRVAVKFIKLAVIGSASADRFRREGAILGKLAHPHIAELIDAGVTANAEPYLILEYVEGQPIDQYCDGHALSIDARITLFFDVLSAVAHAHANLIVHRDIKPSNVLVSTDGRVKLLDFGIAKLLAGDEHSAAASTITLEGGGVLTPRFAAPEQLTDGVITTATDVYALGVLLYLLLTGRHPAGNAPRSPAQLLKAVVEDETRPPSTAISSADADVAATRATAPDRLRRQLRGDLDTIVGKALKKTPDERYASVTALAEDLRRYLTHQPIGARPDTFSYRARKFARRNRTAIGLVSIAVLAIIAGLVGTLMEARTARRQRDFAFRQLSRAEAINELNLVVLGEGYQSPEMIDRAERILAQQQEATLADRVEILITLGTTANLSNDGGAQSHRLLEEAYQLSRKQPEPGARAKAACALAGDVSYGADPARSEALVREGLDALPRQAEFALDRVSCLRIGGAVSRAKGAANEAISRLQLAQQVLKEAPIPSWRLDFLTSLDLGNALRLAGRLREASRQFEQIAARLTAQGRGDTGAAASVYYSWGVTLSQLGRPLEAERLIHRAIVRDSGSEDAPDALPWQLISHAVTLRDLGRLDEAAAQAERGYDKSLANGDQVRVNQALLLRASIYRLRGDLARAEAMLNELEPRLRRSLPAGHIFFASLLSEQSRLAEARGDVSTAFDRVNQALAIANASAKAGQQGADIVPTLLTYRSETERQLGRTGDALADATEALARIRDSAQPGTFSVLAGRAYLALGRGMQSQGKNNEALTNFRLAAEQLQSSLGADHSETHAAQESVAAVHAAAR
jgi:eukaryotic-like serine/threonine-protein kinase